MFFAAACVACGVVCAFAMPGTSFWPAMFVGLSAFYILYSKTGGAGQAFLCGFLFALGYFVTGLWWIGNALLVEGNEYAWVWPISVIGLPTLLGLFTGAYLGVARMIKSPDTLAGFLCFAFFLTFSEWARGNAFTGFPWNLYGYVWLDHLPMAQFARYVGAYGLTLISVLWAATAGFLYTCNLGIKEKSAITVVALLSLGLVFYAGSLRLQSHPTEFDSENAVVVVQPNIAQSMKWDPLAVQDNFKKIVHLSKTDVPAPTPKNIFIIWPETAISPSVYTVPANMDDIRTLLESYSGSNAYLVTGILRQMQKEDGSVNFANSVVFMNESLTALDIYDKTHLVPFGEFIPFQSYIPLKPVASFKGFERGRGAQTIQRNNIPAFSPLICYEIIFPAQVIAPSTPKPKWIVTVTNDGWYGDSDGPRQHFAQARLRAIEEGMPVIRSANTGISGVIDSYGRIVAKADIFQTGAVVSNLPKSLESPPPLFAVLFPYEMLICALIFMFHKLCFINSQPSIPKHRE